MRISQSDLSSYMNTKRGNHALGRDAIHFLDYHPITVNIEPESLGRTIRDLHHLISISRRILEITSYVLVVRRLQVINHAADHLQKLFADQVDDTDRNRLSLEDLLENALPSSVDHADLDIVRELEWRPLGSVPVRFSINLVRRTIAEAQLHACTLQTFVAACFFLHAPVSKKPPYEFIDGGQPSRVETKKRRQHIDMTDPSNIGWLFERITRPLAERGEVAYKHASSGYNYLLEQHRLHRIKTIISAWIHQMRERGETFHIRDITKSFSITYAKYVALEEEMAMEGLIAHADLSTVRQRLPTFTLAPKLFEQLEDFAQNQGFTLHHALNEIVREFFARRQHEEMVEFFEDIIQKGLRENKED